MTTFVVETRIRLDKVYVFDNTQVLILLTTFLSFQLQIIFHNSLSSGRYFIKPIEFYTDFENTKHNGLGRLSLGGLDFRTERGIFIL